MAHSDNCVWCGNSLNTDNGPVQLVGGSPMHAECELDYYGMETFHQEQDIAEVAAWQPANNMKQWSIENG